MSTNLEKYLKHKRQELDVESPDDQLIWEGIRKEMQAPISGQKNRTIWLKFRNLAAAALVILALGYMIGDLVGERRSGSNVGLASLNDELGHMESEYKDMLAVKLLEAGTYNPDIQNLVVAELYEEIQKLDTIYELTLKDLGELGYNDQIIQTIFDTYEKKIYLLELIILENNKNKYNETDQSLFL